jgi:hypothetical protein
MPDLLQDSLDVKVEDQGYTFRIPTIHDEIKIGIRVKNLRRALEPDWDGFDQGLDSSTRYYLRACATFEVLLTASSSTWVYSKDLKTGILGVDSAKFPAANAEDVLAIYNQYQEDLARFRTGGLANNQQPSE